MFWLGSSVGRFRTATALAALIAAGAALGEPQTPGSAQAAVGAPAATAEQAPPGADAASRPDSAAAPPAQEAPSKAEAGAEPAPKPSAAVQGPNKPPMNQAIRDALPRDAAEARPATVEMRALRRAVDAFYASRGDAPVWLDDHGQWTPAAHAAFEQLQRAPDDGLDLRAYRVFSLDQGSEKARALGDVALSEAVAAYAAQASGGRIDPKGVSRQIDVHPPIVPAAQALDQTSRSADAAKTLEDYNPRQPGYLALKAKLAELREAPETTGRIAAAERGRRMSDAPAAYGARRETNLENDILTNMEFWRWLPRDLGADRVVVNVPEFTARLYRDNNLVLPVRVITGKPDKPTPLFSDKIEYIIVNPSWNVPQSIIRNELMPHLDALRAQGYEIRYVNGQLHVRQPPGERNALGQIKFVFPNDYAVYMHDTPTRNLFATSRRAYSHGCVRVDQPFRFAEDLLQPANGWTEERLRKMVGKSERRVNLPAPMPIHIVYFTLSVDDSGALRRFDDIYGYSRKTREMLGLGG
ncbi:L,D-transpeptidase family protein [Rhodoblastus sp.]|uniref:L,D-transpeptidase family protein n=1 Tax=Rhodoblastus sp. TaxID=1962975 RepID=UPI00260D573F|nr:L,D-transpeptidase family protein [Rhodoblastus sp.]